MSLCCPRQNAVSVLHAWAVGRGTIIYFGNTFETKTVRTQFTVRGWRAPGGPGGPEGCTVACACVLLAGAMTNQR